MSIANQLTEIRKHIPAHVSLVCVSKFHSNEDILEAYNVGERIFGESKVQELCDKQINLPKDIHWHFIGHLQTNKVKYIVPFVELIHAVDSIKLLGEIDKQAAKNKRIQNCLIQVHLADEDTKFGFAEDEILDILEQTANYKNVNIKGLMGMATFTDNKEQIQQEFKTLKRIFDKVKISMGDSFTEISMGMSDDYLQAIEEGSTMVRIGSSIFGQRNYG